jgi:hypothetical protein
LEVYILLFVEAGPIPAQFLAKPEEPVGCGPRQYPSDSKGPVRSWPETVLFISYSLPLLLRCALRSFALEGEDCNGLLYHLSAHGDSSLAHYMYMVARFSLDECLAVYT